MGLAAYLRLMRAGFVLSREGAWSLISPDELPAPARFAIAAARLIERRSVRKTGRVERLTRALNQLGPTYVKFGQTLATRPDIVGAAIAEDLGALQDRMAPFDEKLVPGMLENALGDKAEQLTDLSAPIAAASIAQVHKAVLVDADGQRRTVAVKILRPGVADRFRRDLESYYAGARLAERFVPALRRLKPLSVVETLDRSAQLELDLRFEAAAISEFSENIAGDDGFEVPNVHWSFIAPNVLTTDFVDGVPMRDLAALDAAGIDRKQLAAHLMQSFLRHAIRDGFFHADMHPGNLFADPVGHGVVAVDFGIMGRIGTRERRFLAQTLYGFIKRDYRAMAEQHIDIGYVSADQSVDDFALALRSIGEPLHGKRSRDISMARVLGQLLAITELFDMHARPELLLLQKTMVLVEGVARALDPDLNIWDIAEPVVAAWLREQAGPRGRLTGLKEEARALLTAARRVPGLLARADTALALHEKELQKPRGQWLYRTGVVAMILVSVASALVIFKVVM